MTTREAIQRARELARDDFGNESWKAWRGLLDVADEAQRASEEMADCDDCVGEEHLDYLRAALSVFTEAMQQEQA